MMPQPLQLLTISGSLRAASSNTATLLALRSVAPAGVSVTLFDRLDALPHFNPDMDGETATLPREVAALRAEVGRSDGVIISSPEYAHGMPGALKNALDWLVGSTEFPGKPVAVINVSPYSMFVHAALRETLVTMSAAWIDDPALTVLLPRRGLRAEEMAADKKIADALRAAIDAVIRACGAPQSPC
jgi:NAD(P)H-dependent FMN reductase